MSLGTPITRSVESGGAHSAVPARRVGPGCALLIAVALAWTPVRAGEGRDLEQFDGSFRLKTGEVLTGGYMVEGGKGRWVFIDTQGLEKGGLFEPVGGDRLQALGMPEDQGVGIEFEANEAGRFDTMIWREPGAKPVRGERVFAHTTETVHFRSRDGTVLDGRLLLPECQGPHPLVVSVHGSGAVNRYGGTFHTYFIKHGVAVLAYDKRGYTSDPGAWTEPDYAEMSADAAAALRYAASLNVIDADRVGYFGSSQAGWVVPPAAIDAEETAFQILRAGAALTPVETYLHEVRQELRAEGLSGLDLDSAMALRREVYRLASRGAPIGEADVLVAPFLDEPWYRKAFGDEPVSRMWSDRWWQWAGRNSTDASATYLERFEGPVLWFLAERDENVPYVATRLALERAFEAAPADDHELVVIADAPHSFIIEDEAGNPRYAEGFFNRMASWMAERGISNEACWEN